MTDNDLAGEIRQALEDTTPGPWVWTRHDLDSTIRPFYSVIAVDHDGGCGCRRACDLQIDISDADRALIAAAPDLLARAADRIEQLERVRYTDRRASGPTPVSTQAPKAAGTA